MLALYLARINLDLYRVQNGLHRRIHDLHHTQSGGDHCGDVATSQPIRGENTTPTEAKSRQ